jgi:hypothetical protein
MNLDGKCVPQCEGCDYNKNEICEKFLCPGAKFRVGITSCGMATHLMTRVVEDSRVRVGQQKQKRKNPVV